mgnify:CR=1 FL=1
MADERTPEEKEAARLEGIRLCKRKAQFKAIAKKAPFVVIDRGEQFEPFPEGRHRYICRSFRMLGETMQPHWQILVIVEPRSKKPHPIHPPDPNSKRTQRKKMRQQQRLQRNG